jgi:hypothetical protein
VAFGKAQLSPSHRYCDLMTQFLLCTGAWLVEFLVGGDEVVSHIYTLCRQ